MAARSSEKAERQRRAALDKGNELRHARAELKWELKRNEIELAEALNRPEAQGMRVVEVLENMALISPRRHVPIRRGSHSPNKLHLAPAKILQKAAMSHSRVVGHMTARERQVLLNSYWELAPYWKQNGNP